MSDYPAATPPPAENPFWAALRQPRIVLLLLAAWNVLIAVSEFFIDVHQGKIRGPIGGAALSWEAIPLAVLYLYCARDPARYQRVFWLAMIQQAAAIAAYFYHWGAGDVTPGSIVIPLGIAAGLGVLVFLHLFQPKEREAAASY
jgi:hypothetical protein